MSTSLPSLSSIESAIVTAEGTNTYNNPGNLHNGDVGYGVTSTGATIYGEPEDGESALTNQLQLIQSGQSQYYTPNESIAQIGQTWANGDPSWAQKVGASLGVDPNTTTLFGTPANGSSSSASNAASASGGSSSVVSSLSGFIQSVQSGSWLFRGVVVLLGVLLFAAGIFGLDKVQESVKMGVKAVADA